MFEAAMYSFVFLWTMAMSPNKESIKHGLIFVNFMTASMLGSFLAGVLMKRVRPESYMKGVFGVAMVALLVPLVMALDTTKHPGGRGSRRRGRPGACLGGWLFVGRVADPPRPQTWGVILGGAADMEPPSCHPRARAALPRDRAQGSAHHDVWQDSAGGILRV